MNDGLSVADAIALERSGSGYNGSNGMFGGDWAWIILLVLLGWGGNGFGFGGGFGGGSRCGAGTTCATPADVYGAVDQQTLISKLDQQTYGLADSTFALNNTITNGFFGVQNALCQGFNGLNVAYLQGTNQLSSQLADCCCKTQRAIDGVNYNMATNTCAITNAITMNTRDIIDNQNANYRAIHEELVANKLEAKNDRIAELTAQVNKLQLAASQERQNNFLVNELRPCPIPAYITCNPYQSYGTFGNNNCGCGCGY